jgi:L-iditol 2-dehydrogenase
VRDADEDVCKSATALHDEKGAMTHQDTMIGLFKTARGPGNLALRDAPVPSPAPNEALIEIKAAGICGTDIHIKHDEFPYWPPVILGHEFSGMIIEAGKDVTAFRVGDRVVGEPHTRACGKCYLCRTGNIQICAQKRSPGWGIHGAFARYLAMPEHLLHPIPDSMSFEEAAVVEPAANVVQDVIERGRVEPNEFVVINGPGPIGLMAVMAARLSGAATIVMVGASVDQDKRLPLARELGADEVIVADKQDAIARVMEMTNGRGADLVVEASGAGPAVKASVQMLRKLGRITAIGLTGKPDIPFPWDVAMSKVLTVLFNMSTGYTCWDRTIGLIASGKMPVRKIISHVEPLDNWEPTFEAVESKRALKALLIP